MTNGSPAAGALDFAAFLEVVAERTGLTADGEGDATLDSFQVLELVVLCEELAPAKAADEAPPALTSVEDAFSYFTSLSREAAATAKP